LNYAVNGGVMMRRLQGNNRGRGDVVNLIMGIVKNLFLLTIALIAIGDGLPALAADMAVKAPPPSAPAAPYNWSGLYVGGNFGGAWTSGNLTIQGNNF
jgi:hypothetical protein